MLIVNADDLGYDASTNAAIVKSFQQGLCSSTTLLANMAGFEDACELVHANGLVNHVGLHLNVSEGTPLMDEIRRSPRFCDKEGHFRLLRKERIPWLGNEERRLLASEVRAQIGRLKAMSLPITHLDSHKNIHEEWGIFTTVLPLVKEAGIPYIRLSRNIGKRSSLLKEGYRALVNFRLRRLGLSRTRYFGSIQDYEEESVRKHTGRIDQSCEIMIHPCFGPDGEVIDLLSRGALDAVAREYNFPRLAVSYGGHCYERVAS